MVADRITVGVYALEQLSLPKAAAGRGWALRLSEAEPRLTADVAEYPLVLDLESQDAVLAEAALIGSQTHPTLAKVAVERIPGRRGLYLFRIAGKPAAVAAEGGWEACLAPRVGQDGEAGTAGFAAGTLIDTPDGPRAAGTLAVGDVVTTLANGSRPLRWVGRRAVSVLEMLAHPALRPVEFAAGTVGNARPLLVSPQKRLLIDDWRAEVYFGEDRVLVAAQALVDDRAARQLLPAGGVDYVSLLCDRHEVLLAEGALSESFHPGEGGLSALSTVDRAAIEAVVTEEDLRRRRAAFPIVRNAEARALRL